MPSGVARPGFGGAHDHQACRRFGAARCRKSATASHHASTPVQAWAERQSEGTAQGLKERIDDPQRGAPSKDCNPRLRAETCGKSRSSRASYRRWPRMHSRATLRAPTFLLNRYAALVSGELQPTGPQRRRPGSAGSVRQTNREEERTTGVEHERQRSGFSQCGAAKRFSGFLASEHADAQSRRALPCQLAPRCDRIPA